MPETNAKPRLPERRSLKPFDSCADDLRMRTRIVAALVAVWLSTPLTAHGAMGFIPSGAGGTHWAQGLLRLPLLAFHRCFNRQSSSETQDQQRLEASRGWQTIGFATHVAASGCFIRLDGRAEFDRAEVVFADGDLRELELQGARRGKGVYELTTWEEPRSIVCVRLRARACSDEARVSLLLRD